jgi:serine/threonine protein kinase
VKRVRKQRDAWDEKKEIAAMAMVRRFPQNFAYLYGWYESHDCIFLAMDYFEMGDLSRHLESKIPENQARGITQQLLRGLVELHRMGITHRDLKPTNIFVVSRSASSWDVRIGDFGISKRVNADETALRTITGTRHYMAPELDPWLADNEEDHSYTQAVDIWALGILLFQMLTLQMTFPDPASLRKYFKGRIAFPEEPLLQESVTSPCIEFLMAVLQPNPKDRPTSNDTFSYKWMEASSSDTGIASVQALLSEVRINEETCAVGGPIDTRQHRPNVPGSMSPFRKAKLQLMVDDAAYASPLRSQRRAWRQTSESHPTLVKHNTKQNALPNLKRPPSYARDNLRSKEHQSGSLWSDPDLRLTGRLALRARTNCES